MINKQQIKYIRSLQQKKYRDEEGVFIVEGLKLVNEAIDCLPHLLKEVYISSAGKSKEVIKTLPKSCAFFEITKDEFSRISSLKAPQGILALVKKPPLTLPEFKTLEDIVIALDRVSDPGNLGTIIRLADWFGISNIVCSYETVDCFNPKVVQASMGSVLRVNIIYTDLQNFIGGLKNQTGFSVYGTTLEGENIYQTKLQNPAIIIFGNEANGVSENLKHLIDQNLLIPNFSSKKETSESLNVSIAAAIVCSEFRRQLSDDHSK